MREALDDLPDLLRKALDHVAVVISDKGRRHRAYGLYQGDTVARDNYPDRIIIFRDTLLRDFGHDADELRAQVTRTVRHELAHHLGADELGVQGAGPVMIVMTPHATEGEVAAVRERLETMGLHVLVMPGELTTAIGAIGDPEAVREAGFEGMEGVDRVVPISRPYKLASSELFHEGPSVFDIAGRTVGGNKTFCLIAGPCTVETREQTMTVARTVKAAGASMLRGGAYKPRTSPFAFKGLGPAGLEILAEAKAETGLPVVTELLDSNHADVIHEHADVVQIGARNMQNYALLEVAGKLGLPVLLKRGLSLIAGGAADGGGLRPQGGQRARDAVRARHPHVRDRDALHARPLRRAVAEAPHPPAGDRRPEPRHRRPPPGRAAGARRRRGRRRRHHRRGPQRPRGRPLRRRRTRCTRTTSPTSPAASRPTPALDGKTIA